MKKFIVFLLISIFVMPLTCYGEWISHQHKDRMDDSVTKYITCEAKELIGDTKVRLVVFSSGRILITSVFCFSVDDITSSLWVQHTRIRFDKNPPVKVDFYIREGGGNIGNILDLIEYKGQILHQMLRHKTMLIEVKCYGTQVLEFDLTGFAKAYNNLQRERI